MDQFEQFTPGQDFIPADLSALSEWSENSQIYQNDLKSSPYDDYPLILNGPDTSSKESISANFPSWNVQFSDTLEANDNLSSCASSIGLPRDTMASDSSDPSLPRSSDLTFSPEKSTWFPTNSEYHGLDNMPALVLPSPAYPDISQNTFSNQVPASSEPLPELTYLTDESSPSPPHFGQSNWMSSLSSFDETPSSMNDSEFYRIPSYDKTEVPPAFDASFSNRPLPSSGLSIYPAPSSPSQLRRTTSSTTLFRKPSPTLSSDRRSLNNYGFEPSCSVNRESLGQQRRGNAVSRPVTKAKSMSNMRGSAKFHASASSTSLAQQASTSTRSSRRHTQSRAYKECQPLEFGHAFVNFTPKDSHKLLAGVAPSGSSKTKARREQEAKEKKKRLEAAALRAIEQAGGNLDELERAIY